MNDLGCVSVAPICAEVCVCVCMCVCVCVGGEHKVMGEAAQ